MLGARSLPHQLHHSAGGAPQGFNIQDGAPDLARGPQPAPGSPSKVVPRALHPAASVLRLAAASATNPKISPPELCRLAPQDGISLKLQALRAQALPQAPQKVCWTRRGWGRAGQGSRVLGGRWGRPLGWPQ